MICSKQPRLSCSQPRRTSGCSQPALGGKYPNQAFTAFIPAASAAQFPQPQQYEGRTVTVSGKITLYKGKPEIIVNSPSQISAK